MSAESAESRLRVTWLSVSLLVVASVVALLGFGAIACCLGLTLAFDELKHGRRVALLCVVAITASAYAFIPVVGYQSAYFEASIAGYLASVLVALLPVWLAFAATRRVATSLETRAVVLPISWALASSIVPAVFPFRPAYLAVTSLPIAQWLSIGGPTFVDAIVIGLGTAVVVFLWGRVWARVVSLLFVLAIVSGGDFMLTRERAARAPDVAIGVVSPAIALREARDPHTRRARLERLHTLSSSLSDTALVVWPESVYPHRLRPDAREDVPLPDAIRPADMRAPMLAGAAVGDEPCRPFSSLVAVTRDGRIAARVDKQRRMPFGDVVPLRSVPAIAARFPCGTRAGERFAPIVLGALRVGVLVCFDEIDESVARERVRAGANLLVSGANDAWYAGTFEPVLHARVARARAIETRRDLVRAVNLGEGGLVASTGEVVVRIRGTSPEAVRVQVALHRGQTLAVRFGDFVAPAFAVFLLIFAIVSRKTRARAAADVPA